MVTDEQVRLVRKKLMEGKTQESAAAAGGMSERTARRWLSEGLLPSQSKGPREWRTRPDPFERVWDSDVLPLLGADPDGRLQAKTVMQELLRRHPDDFDIGQLRTLQRRVRDWRALSGPEKEVFFPQEHVPGREGAFDFTDASDLGVTICGEPFEHLLFEFVLSFSSWFAARIAYSESYESLSAGLQAAVWELGASPSVWRSDNLSAATHELKGGGRGLTRRYEELVSHYGAKSTRIRPGKANENGVAEQRHYRTKTALDQALRLRGNRDFPDLASYEGFVQEVVVAERAKSERRLEQERPLLLSLPPSALPSYTTLYPHVSGWSTVRVNRHIYSVPSRLIGEDVELRLHPAHVEILYHDKLVERFPRLRGDRPARIDYRHVIWSLVRKPGAFARYRYRHELFPALVFRRAYDDLVARTERADVEYVRILHLAASTMQCEVEKALGGLLDAGEPFDYATVAGIVKPQKRERPTVSIPVPDVTSYDHLLEMAGAR